MRRFTARRQLRAFTELVAVIPFAAREAEAAATVRATLEQQGQPIGPYDVLIVGQARRRPDDRNFRQNLGRGDTRHGTSRMTTDNPILTPEKRGEDLDAALRPANRWWDQPTCSRLPTSATASRS